MFDDAPPSLWRIPITLALALLATPIAPMAWVALSGSRRRSYLRSGLVRWGFGIVIGSALPLLVFALVAMLGLAGRDPNPIGLGLLLVAGAFIGTILAIIGIVAVAIGRRE